MLLLSRVCAEFRDRSGAVVFTVTPPKRLVFQEAPEAIREDPLFGMLLHDRSIEVAEDNARRKQLENDPMPASAPPAEEAADAATPAPLKPSGRKAAAKKDGE